MSKCVQHIHFCCLLSSYVIVFSTIDTDSMAFIYFTLFFILRKAFYNEKYVSGAIKFFFKFYHFN